MSEIRDSQTREILSEILTLLWDVVHRITAVPQTSEERVEWFLRIEEKIQELHKKL